MINNKQLYMRSYTHTHIIIHTRYFSKEITMVHRWSLGFSLFCISIISFHNVVISGSLPMPSFCVCIYIFSYNYMIVNKLFSTMRAGVTAHPFHLLSPTSIYQNPFFYQLSQKSPNSITTEGKARMCKDHLHFSPPSQHASENKRH